MNTKNHPVKKTTKHKNLYSSFEKKVDSVMSFLDHKLKFVHNIIKSSFVKKILGSKIITNTNKSFRENLPTTSKIIWWIIVVFAWIWLLTTLSTIRAIWFFVEYLGWLFFLLIIFNLLYIIMSWLLWFWFIKMKKRVPFFITLIIVLDLAYMILATLMSSLSSVPSPWMIIFYIIFAIYILKNQDLFTK